MSVRSFSYIITFRHYYNMPNFYRIQIWGLKCCLQYLTDWFNYLLPYLFIAWSRFLLGKLIGSQLVKKFPAFYGAERFVTSFTSARHLSVSWVRSIQSIPLNTVHTPQYSPYPLIQSIPLNRVHTPQYIPYPSIQSIPLNTVHTPQYSPYPSIQSIPLNTVHTPQYSPYPLIQSIPLHPTSFLYI